MSKILIANFKANGSKEFFNNWLSHFDNESQNQILLSPPSVYLDFFSEKKINFELCSQNVCEFEEGAFTSQHTASMLLDLGVKSCIIGHSESRSLLKEEDHQIFEKFQKLNNKKIRPIVCIGEPLEIRESNKVKDYIKNQTKKFHDFEGEIIFGYEPLWAIGSGKVPKLDEIKDETNTRFMIITHHRLTMARMDRLYGVTMSENGVSQLVSVNLEKAIKLKETA